MPQIIRTLFETELASYLNVPNVIAVNSGTSALIGALWSLDLKPEDEVITTPFTFISTTNAIIIAGGKPVFVDIKKEDHLIDDRRIEEAITKNTKAIVPVHLFGRTCNMTEIMRIAKKFDLIVIEDAAQSFGCLYQNSMTGSIGDAGCFSFYKTKNLSTFEGGAIAIKNESKLSHDKIRAICDPGINRIDGKYIGFNFRMPEPCALIGYEKLKLHKPTIEAEIGRYDERNGFYKKLVYQYEVYRELGHYPNCPIAEEVVKQINASCK